MNEEKNEKENETTMELLANASTIIACIMGFVLLSLFVFIMLIANAMNQHQKHRRADVKTTAALHRTIFRQDS